MVDFRQLACSLLGSLLFRLSPPGQFVIVGAGSAGLAMLKTLLDLPVETRAEWDIVLYEQRRDIGGIWCGCQIHHPPPPPKLPETPLYPLLHTDTPVPIMTYPHFPFPPGTPLFPTHGYIERYHQDYATHYGLWPYIKLGRYHEPHMVIFPGQDTWLENNKGGLQREILHSMWYRNPSWYADRTVIVVGGGPSGVGIASQVLQYAHRVYLSVRSPPREVPLGRVELKPEILHFTSDGAVFTDGSTVQDVDTVLLATGYDLRVPFLEEGGEVIVKPGSNKTDGHKLATNLRYLFPLHQHIFSLSASYPTNALAFIGLPRSPYYPIYATSIIANGSLLALRVELLRELADSEEDLRRRGYDPYYVGHKMVNNSTFDYQEGLIKTLRSKEGLPEQNIPFRGWKRLEALGLAEEWLEGVESEDEWADLMRRVNAWQRDWEAVHHLVFPDDVLVYS
ncbi:hypothetical protein F5J12DRAFT_821430 [Pisolithus orientalis]|uniref:uncharacterized protein n=1 Tax=Pisolithus orientalis TaxID=936130 RepID=UPI00222589EC|nr:uncharacterized protein F5J12DRAFT_821430 [Pisolithus orientalis]KAI6010740.1 hypothetical protein F5J12DRAFT_821430 [Pisolithus orientalis]